MKYDAVIRHISSPELVDAAARLYEQHRLRCFWDGQAAIEGRDGFDFDAGRVKFDALLAADDPDAQVLAAAFIKFRMLTA